MDDKANREFLTAYMVCAAYSFRSVYRHIQHISGRKCFYRQKKGEANLEPAEVSEAEYSRIKRFRVYMDGLARSPAGKTLYDSIIHHRPGLMDSVWFIENYYQQLKQK